MCLFVILFLLFVGIILGLVIGWLKLDELLGDMLFLMVLMVVVVILFEGSLIFKFKEIWGMENVVWCIIIVGVLVSWFSMFYFCWWLL